MNKKMMLAAVLLALAIGLCGCQFAMEEGASTGGDMLCGVALYVNDPGEPDGINEDGCVYWNSSGEQDDRAMPERELSEEEIKALIAGKNIGSGQDEMALGRYYYYLYRQENDYGITVGAEQNWPGKIEKQHITENDAGTGLELEATVYLCGEWSEYAALTLAPVYQRPDGTVYARREMHGVSGNIDGFTQTYSTESKTSAANGDTAICRTEIQVHFVQASETENAQVLAFDAQHRLMETRVLEAEESDMGLTCEYMPPQGAAYLLLETTNSEGVVARQSADLPFEQYETNALFTYLVPNGDGFCVPCRVYLAWQE